jgi:PKD repeat protein
VVATSAPVSDALDPDGYEITLIGPDSARAPIGGEARRRFSPLRAGVYTVAMTGLVSRCEVVGEATRTVTVTDTSATTIVPVTYNVVCRDSRRGEIDVTVAVTGADRDPEFFIDVLGEATDATLPAAERVYSARRSLPTALPRTRFINVRPGTYDVRLDSVAPNCTLEGNATRRVNVAEFTVAPVNFAVSCVGSGPPPSTAPFVWRNTWTPANSAPGTKVQLDVELDISSDPARRLLGVQADLKYDPAILRFEEEIVRQLPAYTLNTNVPGVISFIASTTPTSLRSGNVRVMTFEFTVIGAEGSTVTTLTEGVKASDRTSAGIIPFSDSVGVQEATFTVAAGGVTPPPPPPPGGNTPPTAVVGGPYVGSVGNAIAFSSTGSSDVGGSIAAYLWSFGDGTSSTVANPFKTYSAAGVFPVTLTVTDNQGATGSASTTASIAAAPAPINQLPQARANGPYSVAVGTPLTLSSGGSFDPDGSLVSYQWTLGDGRTASGPAPTVSYPTAGTYSVTVTVTDNLGATANSTTTVTVTAATPLAPLRWRAVFSPVDVALGTVALTISYDLRTDIPETPGAEALAQFTVDSLKWDASKLQFQSISLGPNISGSSNQAGVFGGRIGLTGTVSGAQQQGLITLATIRFAMVGAPGSVVTTTTALGPLIGAASTNFFVYNAKTSIVEGQVTLP